MSNSLDVSVPCFFCPLLVSLLWLSISLPFSLSPLCISLITPLPASLLCLSISTACLFPWPVSSACLSFLCLPLLCLSPFPLNISYSANICALSVGIFCAVSLPVPVLSLFTFPVCPCFRVSSFYCMYLSCDCPFPFLSISSPSYDCPCPPCLSHLPPLIVLVLSIPVYLVSHIRYMSLSSSILF